MFFLFLKKIFIYLFKFSVFRNIKIFIFFSNVFEMYFLNKKFKKNNYFSDILTFNYYKKSYIFLNFNLLKKNIILKKNIFFLLFYKILHCFLHSQNFNDSNPNNNKIIIFFQNKILLLNLNFILLCRLQDLNL